MKIELIDHQNGDKEIMYNSIYVYDGENNQYRLRINDFGELEVQGSNGAIRIEPRNANEIILKTV